MSGIATRSPKLPRGITTSTTDQLVLPAADATQRTRNHAPGIPDRRRSLRPSRVKSSPRQSLNKNAAISIRVAMADTESDAAEVKVGKEKDDSDDEKPVRVPKGGEGET